MNFSARGSTSLILVRADPLPRLVGPERLWRLAESLRLVAAVTLRNILFENTQIPGSVTGVTAFSETSYIRAGEESVELLPSHPSHFTFNS